MRREVRGRRPVELTGAEQQALLQHAKTVVAEPGLVAPRLYVKVTKKFGVGPRIVRKYLSERQEKEQEEKQTPGSRPRPREAGKKRKAGGGRKSVFGVALEAC
eukprot:1193326-Lingulodinium_polyedra.AAC.1